MLENIDPNMLIAAIVPSVVVIGLFLFLLTRSREKASISKKLKHLTQEEAPSYNEELAAEYYDVDTERSGSAKLMSGLLGILGIDYQEQQAKLAMRFAQAGIRNPNAPIYYAFAKTYGMPIAIILALLLAIPILQQGDASNTMKMAAAMGGIIIIFIGLSGADLALRNMKDKRQFVLQRSFPDALDLILVCVEAGLALDAALSRVCRELEGAHPEITYELNKTRMELTLLNDRSRALQNLAARTDMVSFKALTSALIQSEKFGTSLSETLRVLADDYRNTRMLMAENKANRLPALMTVPLMLLLMPAFIMILIGPALIMLNKTMN